VRPRRRFAAASVNYMLWRNGWDYSARCDGIENHPGSCRIRAVFAAFSYRDSSTTIGCHAPACGRAARQARGEPKRMVSAQQPPAGIHPRVVCFRPGLQNRVTCSRVPLLCLPHLFLHLGLHHFGRDGIGNIVRHAVDLLFNQLKEALFLKRHSLLVNRVPIQEFKTSL
jgi:hypothetical protein